LSGHQLRVVHLALAVVWALLIIPTIVWWAHSILWVAGCSLYANVVAHLAAFGGARAEDA
jgi:hypothetical protein